MPRTNLILNLRSSKQPALLALTRKHESKKLQEMERIYSHPVEGMGESDRNPSLASIWRDQVRGPDRTASTLKPPRRPFASLNSSRHSLATSSSKNCYESARGYFSSFAQKDYASAQTKLSADPHSPGRINWLVAAREKLGDQKGAKSARLRLKYPAAANGGVVSGDSSERRFCPLSYPRLEVAPSHVLPRQPARFEFQADSRYAKLFSNRRVIHTRIRRRQCHDKSHRSILRRTEIPSDPEQPTRPEHRRGSREQYPSRCHSRRPSLPCQQAIQQSARLRSSRSISVHFEPPSGDGPREGHALFRRFPSQRSTGSRSTATNRSPSAKRPDSNIAVTKGHLQPSHELIFVAAVASKVTR